MPLQSMELTLTGEEALKVADVLTSTNLRILRLLSQERLEITAIAERLKLSQPYVSEQIRKLEATNLVKVSYETGRKGIKKVCELAVRKIIITITP